MASVQSSYASQYARHGVVEDEPSEHVESAGEILIKQLVQKQTNTSITLEQQLREQKQFERGVGFVSIDELGKGKSSLQQFEERQRHAESVRELEGRGMTRSDALRLVAAGKATEVTVQREEEEVAKECVSRQQMELALSVKPNSLETRLYQFAVKNKTIQSPQEFYPLDHPIHELPAMEKALQNPPDPEKTARTVQRKWRQHLAAMSEPAGVHYKPPERQKSLWDSTEPPVVVEKKPRIEKVVTCKKQSLYTIKDGRIVQVDKNKDCEKAETEPKSKPNGQAFISLQPSTEETKVSCRLSEEEIKKLPRFQNYQRGEESKILYIKNLSGSVTETDLAALFDRFQEANECKIVFRLMTGKMRGQAFITFSSCATATTALNMMNGVLLKGKPMVIQYGKKSE